MMNFAAIFFFETSDDELRKHLEETAARWGAVQLPDRGWGFQKPGKPIEQFLYLLWVHRETLDHRAVLYGGWRSLYRERS